MKKKQKLKGFFTKEKKEENLKSLHAKKKNTIALSYSQLCFPQMSFEV